MTYDHLPECVCKCGESYQRHKDTRLERCVGFDANANCHCRATRSGVSLTKPEVPASVASRPALHSP